MKKKTREEEERELGEIVRAFEEAGLTEENMKRRHEERLRLSATGCMHARAFSAKTRHSFSAHY